LAGQLAAPNQLINPSKLIAAYYDEIPDPAIIEQRVLFGTSGHRGSSLDKTFNERHILAITQAICVYRKQHHIDGPLFIGIDTHALSQPAYASALEVLAANGVETLIAANDEYTPTPVISYAILAYNQGRKNHLADGIVITPSHNPPQDGGFKYNPPTGGPAGLAVSNWIQDKANAYLEDNLKGVKQISYSKARQSKTMHYFDYLNHYVNDLGQVIDMQMIRDANVRIGVNPFGGAGVHYWEPIAAKYGLNLILVNKAVDPTFGFIPMDWDGQIRMDPASPYAMTNFVKLKNQFDIAFACDTDHDRHGIVTPNAGLLMPNHYLAIAANYLFHYREHWPKQKALGKTIVTSQMLDWVAKKWNRSIYEVPVGFKWFVDELLSGFLGYCGEESAGSSFDRLNGDVWTTDKDGMTAGLLAAEMTARLNRDLSESYQALEREFGKTFYERDDTEATLEEKAILQKFSARQVTSDTLGGEKITAILTKAPGNQAPIGGVKIITAAGWFAARPSGTENIYEMFAESYRDPGHLQQILQEGKHMVHAALASAKENTHPESENQDE